MLLGLMGGRFVRLSRWLAYSFRHVFLPFLSSRLERSDREIYPSGLLDHSCAILLYGRSLHKVGMTIENNTCQVLVT